MSGAILLKIIYIQKSTRNSLSLGLRRLIVFLIQLQLYLIHVRCNDIDLLFVLTTDLKDEFLHLVAIRYMRSLSFHISVVTYHSLCVRFGT